MMKRYWMGLFLAAMVLTACEKVPSAYRMENLAAPDLASPQVAVAPFRDMRTDTEIRGAGAGLGNRSTKDALYADSVASAVTLAFVDELRARGINARAVPEGVEIPEAPYRVTGDVLSYRAVIIPPKLGFIPYVKYVTWLWTKDKMSAGVGVRVKVEGSSEPDRAPLHDEEYQLRSDTQAWVGLLGLGSTARRWDRPGLVKLLRTGLKDVLGRAADDVAAIVRKRE